MSSHPGGPDPDDGDAVEFAGSFIDGFEGTVDQVLPPHLRARAWARRRRPTHVLWQAGVLIVGIGLVIAGVAMLVLPGPGWAAIIVGLIVLASEYAWARRVLDPVRRWAARAGELALDPRCRRRNLLIAAGLFVAVGAAVGWYVVTFGVGLPQAAALSAVALVAVR